MSRYITFADTRHTCHNTRVRVMYLRAGEVGISIIFSMVNIFRQYGKISRAYLGIFFQKKNYLKNKHVTCIYDKFL